LSKLPKTWTGRIGVNERRCAGGVQRQPLLLLGQERPAHLDGLQQDRSEVDHLPVEGDLPLVHPRHVEQIVEQPLQLPDLPFDHRARPGRRVGVG
jgi:hypothetical protein